MNMGSSGVGRIAMFLDEPSQGHLNVFHFPPFVEKGQVIKMLLLAFVGVDGRLIQLVCLRVLQLGWVL